MFKKPQSEHQQNPQERPFYGHMRNNQNIPNRQINSNNVNGRQLPPTSPVYNGYRSRTPKKYNRNQINQVADLIAIVDVLADQISKTDHTVIRDLRGTIDFIADKITEIINGTDHKAITEIIIITLIQKPEIAATAIIEVMDIIDHIIIIIAHIIIIITKITKMSRKISRNNSRSPYQPRSPFNKNNGSSQ